MTTFRWLSNSTVEILKNLVELDLELDTILTINTSNDYEITWNGYKLLIVENDKSNQDYLFLHLENDSYKIMMCLTEEEWNDLIQFAVNLTPPMVRDEHCTTCSEYTPTNEHFDCSFLKARVPLFLNRFKTFTDCLIELTVNKVPKILEENCKSCLIEKVHGSYCLCSDIHKETLDVKYITLAYGKISRQTIIDTLENETCTWLGSEILYRNIKACIRQKIEKSVLESFDREIYPQSLDWFL